MFDVLFHSAVLVSVAEIGDKTQLLSIILAARFRRFWPLFWGILFATLLNHALAAEAGHLLAGLASGFLVNLVASLAFIAIGLWILVPDDEPETAKEPKHGAFITTLVVFFMAEMGDKTQLATIALGADLTPLWQVVAGTTLGMMIANVPAVLFGEAILAKIPMKAVRITSCVLFVGFGLWGLLVTQF
ncbi:MAG: TMEM165/GDT1 family protein [Pseudomonadota bacterium]